MYRPIICAIITLAMSVSANLYGGGFWESQKESLNRLIKKFDRYAGDVLSLPNDLKSPHDEFEQPIIDEFQLIEPVYEPAYFLEKKNAKTARGLERHSKWVVQTQVKGLPVKQLIAFMMQAMGENVRFETDITETIDLDQNNANWFQSIYGILAAFDLKIDKVGGLTSYYRVYDFKNENKRIKGLISQYSERFELLKKIRTIEQLEEYYRQPSQIDLFALKYQSATQILAKITPLLAKKYGEIAPLFSKEDENKILFLGSPHQLEVVRSLIQTIDKKEAQIFLEIFIVNVGDNFNQALAGRLNLTAQANGSLNDTSATFLTDLTQIASSVISGKFSILNFLGSARLSLALDTLEKDGLSHTLSNPKIILLNGGSAKIVQGLQFEVEGSTTTATNGSIVVSKSFKDANLNIETKARILPGDGSVELSIDLSNDVPNLTSTPISINKFQIVSSVRVPDGGIVVMGGVLSQAASEEKSGIPFLSDIPILDTLFGGESKTEKLNELMIFISPSIIR